METEALEYHTRAMASDGIIELEKIYQTWIKMKKYNYYLSYSLP
jgi:hypothetical protein